MKDLDFDELDKAVNSLMEKAPKDTPAPAKEAENVVTLPDTAAPEPVVPETQPQAEDTLPKEDKEVKSPTAAPSVAVKRSGRFMDVVHPSSDMRAPSRPSSRTGNTLQPMNDIDTDTPAPTTETVLPTPDTVPEPVETMPVVTTTPDTPEKKETDGWPDPIDMHETAADQAETPAPETETTDMPQDNQATAASSPFLPDTKVEKRPLGGPTAPIVSESGEDQPVDAMPTDTEVKDVADKPVDPVPAELGTDVLAIEAGKDNPGGVADESEQDTPVQLEGGTTAPAPQPAGPTSISQQYKVQESSGDPSHVAIYDTATDSHALTHPAKKKSGWLVVVAILVLVLLGAGAGAFVYFSGIL